MRTHQEVRFRFFSILAPKLDRSLHRRLEDFEPITKDRSLGFPKKSSHDRSENSANRKEPCRELREIVLRIVLWLSSRLLDEAALNFSTNVIAQARLWASRRSPKNMVDAHAQTKGLALLIANLLF